MKLQAAIIITQILRVLTTLFGFIITKADIFPMIAAKGAGQVMLVSDACSFDFPHTNEIMKSSWHNIAM